MITIYTYTLASNISLLLSCSLLSAYRKQSLTICARATKREYKVLASDSSLCKGNEYPLTRYFLFHLFLFEAKTAHSACFFGYGLDDLACKPSTEYPKPQDQERIISLAMKLAPRFG